MKLTARSTLAEVAASVASALSGAGIRAVLTGGACATVYSKGDYQSSDLDFILRSRVGREALDAAMREAGFRRRGNHFEHPTCPFFVEFPAGPLGIGSDIAIRPVVLRLGGVRVDALSPTDSCRDRLAAFYHWNDRQSLLTAVRIAKRRKVDLPLIRRWSLSEGAEERFREFLGLLK